MNHLLCSHLCRRPHWWSPRRRGRTTRPKHTREFSMAPKIYKWQPWNYLCLLLCCVFLCSKNCTKLKKCMDYQIRTRYSLKTLFHQLLNDMNDLHGEGKKRSALVTKSWHKVTSKQLVSLDLKVDS